MHIYVYLYIYTSVHIYIYAFTGVNICTAERTAQFLSHDGLARSLYDGLGDHCMMG